MAPKDFNELEKMMELAIELNKPVVIRYPRGGEEKTFEQNTEIEEGKAEIICKGKDLTIVAIGKMVSRAMEVKELLEKDGIEAEVINARFLKPFDTETIRNSIQKTNKIITIEDNIIKGGLASNVEELIVENNLNEVEMIKFGYPDEFVKHGTVQELEKIFGLDKENIYKEIKQIIEK